MRDSATELVVVRHGETAWNLSGRLQGQLDIELSDLGVRQAEALAGALDNDSFQHLVASDLARAVRTAEIIAQKLGIVVSTDERLREQHLGMMQGCSLAEFRKEHPRECERFRSRDPEYRVPGAETIIELCRRSIACVNELVQSRPGGRILVVTHGGVLDGFFRHATQLDLAAPRRFSLFNASINVFSVANGQWSLRLWGDTRHLRQVGTTDDWCFDVYQRKTP